MAHAGFVKASTLKYVPLLLIGSVVFGLRCRATIYERRIASTLPSLLHLPHLALEVFSAGAASLIELASLFTDDFLYMAADIGTLQGEAV